MDGGRCGVCRKLICGYSRAGKTTYAKQFENVIHLDDFRGFPLAERYKRLTDYVSTLSGDIVVEGIFHTADSRRKLLQSFGEGYRVCLWIDTDLDIIAQRMSGGKLKDRRLVAPAFFEPPSYSEGWDKIIIIRNC